MEVRSITEDQLADLTNEHFELAIHTLPIRKGGHTNQTQYWEFEHNIFLEHLAATVLKKLPVQQILTYTTFAGKVKTRWKDIIAYLLGILDKQQPDEQQLSDDLLQWLVENDPMLLLKVEVTQVPPTLHNEIFKRIFQWSKQTTIWIDRYGDMQQLAAFGETAGNIRYVFDEIADPQNHWRNRANAAELFFHFNLEKIPEPERRQMAERYTELILQQTDHHLLRFLVDHFPFTYIDLLDKIVNKVKYTEDKHVYSSLFRLIEKYELQDRYISVLLNGLKKQEKVTLQHPYSHIHKFLIV